MLSKDEVKDIAKLARLGLDEAQVEKFSKQLSDILEYVELLNEVDTENVPPTSQVTGLMNVTRKDEVEVVCTKDELLACTELPLERGQIKVKPVITY